ncbi:hypothetical protein MAALD49_40270 (plasmid) [Marinobacter shengliensis]|mgnify:FL=1|jgi:hypothetical protein|nr:hypothetical protein MAALD49_40270 [Marinobacter shengliensis]|tara:strand:+ start:1975 stop:2193 length:219 start_codon:yes stop_codon:yes gene_type:complete
MVVKSQTKKLSSGKTASAPKGRIQSSSGCPDLYRFASRARESISGSPILRSVIVPGANDLRSAIRGEILGQL